VVEEGLDSAPAVIAVPVRVVAPVAVQVWVRPDPVIVLTPPEKAASGASYAEAYLAPAKTSARESDPTSSDLKRDKAHVSS
jgi:hypothetical protein